MLSVPQYVKSEFRPQAGLWGGTDDKRGSNGFCIYLFYIELSDAIFILKIGEIEGFRVMRK